MVSQNTAGWEAELDRSNLRLEHLLALSADVEAELRELRVSVPVWTRGALALLAECEASRSRPLPARQAPALPAFDTTGDPWADEPEFEFPWEASHHPQRAAGLGLGAGGAGDYGRGAGTGYREPTDAQLCGVR
jgi:hypothetical protein